MAAPSPPSQLCAVLPHVCYGSTSPGEGPSAVCAQWTAPIVPSRPVLSLSCPCPSQRHCQPSSRRGTPVSTVHWSIGSSPLRLGSVLDLDFRLLRWRLPRHSTWCKAPRAARICSSAVWPSPKVETTTVVRRRNATSIPQPAFHWRLFILRSTTANGSDARGPLETDGEHSLVPR